MLSETQASEMTTSSPTKGCRAAREPAAIMARAVVPGGTFGAGGSSRLRIITDSNISCSLGS